MQAIAATRVGSARVALVGLAAALCSFVSTGSGQASASTAWDRVIVSGTPGALSSVENAVRSAGGQVTHALGVINGVAARVPAGSVPALSNAPGVRAITPDSSGHLMSIDPTLGYDVNFDEGSLYDVAQVTNAKQSWRDFNDTGQGVDVALIDSGVAQVQGLTSGNVVNGPDLSFESQSPSLAHQDTFGHGTFMASVIAGRDQAGNRNYIKVDSHQFNGIAPDARVISIKVANSDGSADVSQVIAGIDWVVSHAHDSGFNIKVLNLSYGTDSTQDPSVDPLDYAVEQAWHAGVTVVVSAGNDGTNRQQLADPANDPLVLAVGADDPNNTDAINDDSVPDFAQRGTSTRYVDVIAPGVHLLGLRDPGSFIDQNNPQAVVNNRFFRGSGTSQSAAVVSGLAALYLSKYPSATPDQVKRALMLSAAAPKSVRKLYTGLGVPRIDNALAVPPPIYVQPPTGATGLGSLEAARGTNHVSDGNTELTGEQDIFGQPWDPATWAVASAASHAWTGGTWNSHAWTGSDWTGTSWSGLTWDSHAWTGATWSGQDWASHAWTSHAWTTNGWDSHAWTDSSWTSHAWTTAGWSSASWS